MRSTEHAATVDLVEHSLHDDLRLDRVAERVGYSPYHLHRSFRAALGLTLHDYVRRRRLTETARALSTTTEPIVDIALRHGFSGQQSFTNAFTAGYGVPPAAWRRSRRFFPLLLPYRFDAAAWELLGGAGDVQVRPDDVEALFPLSLAAVDMLPMINVERHAADLRDRAVHGRVLVARQGGQRAAAAIVDFTGHVEYLAVHPLARSSAVLAVLLHAASAHHPRLTVTTFREGDKADLGHRRALLGLGFTPARLRTEFGYPTQLLQLGPGRTPL